jgi:phosphatidylinositol-4-phosphate 3-kinase
MIYIQIYICVFLAVSTAIEHVIIHVVCELEGDLKGEAGDYVLKVAGLAEYFSCSSTLADYDFIHQCIKLDQDVTLEILKLDDAKRPLARTVS